MERHAIAGEAVAFAGLRDLATEFGGARPGGVRADATAPVAAVEAAAGAARDEELAVPPKEPPLPARREG